MKLYTISEHDRIINFENKNINNENKNLSNLLYKTKCKIDKINLKKWEIAKKFNNIFEYIYTSSNSNKNICSTIPISRSYFKLLEILYEFNFFSDNEYFSCIAEGPGGFIQCIHDVYNYKKLNINIINCITLISQNKKIPYWNNSIMNNPKNNLQYGVTNNGDIYNYDNCIDYINNHNEKCYLVTSDGGFDFSSNYNEQEINSIKLLYSEIFIAINVQKINGNFVIKVFDILNIKTIQLIYILYLHYEKINFYKPDTSRLSNSEKYIVCENFKGLNEDINQNMKKYFDNIEKFNLFIPQSFINDINSFNNKFIKKQIDNINDIIKIINKNKYIENKPTEKQIYCAKNWCLKYNLGINNNF